MVEITSLENLTSFFGWMTVINILVLAVISLAVIALRGIMVSVHSKMTGVPEAELPSLYFRYVANYKLAVFVFNLVPYVALKLIA
jgi:Family of unknown function (DUF6868)